MTTRVIVYHRGYGCATGCCGHAVQVDGNEGNEQFMFEHPYRQTAEEFIKRIVIEEMGAAHVADIDWANCIVVGNEYD